MTTALIDGDEFILKAALRRVENPFADDGEDTSRPADVEEAAERLVEEIDRVTEAVGADAVTLCLSPDDRLLYRRGVYPDYKGGRSEKPGCFWDLVKWARKRWLWAEYPGLEADDVMGILQTDDTVIVSSDKDMKTVPGRLYNPRTKKLGRISQARADWQWMHQTLTGDSTDNYKGAFKIGPIKAEAILDEGRALRTWWPSVKGTFIACGQTADDARTQAILARILRPGDYADGLIKFQLGNETVELDARALAR